MKASSIWQQAQAEELNCWVQISHKLDSDLYLERKKTYWRRILRKAGLDVETLADQTVIEVGAGPSGIFMLFPNKTDFVTLDPLNDEYRRLAPHLFHHQMTIAAPLETYVPEQAFAYVFAINCIDHSDDIELFVKKLAALCAVRGTAVLAVNCHQNRWSEWIWQRFQTALEPHHPYHFTETNYARLLATHFNILHVADIEEEVIWINSETSDDKIPPPTREAANVPRPSPQKRRWLAMRWGRVLGVLFLRVLTFLGWPAHDFAGNGRSLYRHKLFTLQPKS